MAQVTCYDPDGQAHLKEPIDAREACLHNGFTMTLPGAPVAAETAPTLPELLAMRDALLRREGELDDQAARLAELAHSNQAEAERLQLQADANTSEGKRLADAAVQLGTDKGLFDAEKTAFDVAKAAVPATPASAAPVAVKVKASTPAA